MNNETGIVFIHGAGLNSSIWGGLKGKIKNPVLTLDFPNRKSKGTPNARLTFDDYLDTVIAEIKNRQKGDFILVAHSIGACIGLKAAGHFKKELRGFVAIGLVIPESGQSFVSSLPFPQKLLLPVLLSLFGTKPPPKSIEAELCHDLSPEMTSKVVNEFTAEAKALYTTGITFDLPDTRRLYITLTDDKSISPGLQDQMAKNFKAREVAALHSGHLPMLSRAEELAGILRGFVDKV